MTRPSCFLVVYDTVFWTIKSMVLLSTKGGVFDCERHRVLNDNNVASSNSTTGRFWLWTTPSHWQYATRCILLSKTRRMTSNIVALSLWTISVFVDRRNMLLAVEQHRVFEWRNVEYFDCQQDRLWHYKNVVVLCTAVFFESNEFLKRKSWSLW